MDGRRSACTYAHGPPEQARQREVYVISPGGPPEPTQSLNFHESLSEGEGERTDRRRMRTTVQGGLKDKRQETPRVLGLLKRLAPQAQPWNVSKESFQLIDSSVSESSFSTIGFHRISEADCRLMRKTINK